MSVTNSMSSRGTCGESVSSPKLDEAKNLKPFNYHPTSERHPLTAFRWWLSYVLILWPIRIFFGWLIPPVLRYFWHNGVYYHLAQDDKPVYEGVRCIAEDYPYGPHFRETMDIVIPDPESNKLDDSHGILALFAAVLYDIWCLLTCYPRAIFRYVKEVILGWKVVPDIKEARKFPAMLFVHGGGHCAIDASIQHHQCTAFGRAGYALYMINYPHAPEDPFPASTISTLRAMRFLKEVQGHDKVILIGESAGGNLVTVAAGVVVNKTCLHEFAVRAREIYNYHDENDRLENWDFPSVSSVVSWYGILDAHSWKWARWLWFGLNWCFDCLRGFNPMPPVMMNGPEFGWQFHNSQLNEAQIRRRFERQKDPYLTLACMSTRIKKYPPTFLVAGSEDPLGLLHSTEVAFENLRQSLPHFEKEGKLKLKIHPCGHAFIGLNPFVLWFLQGSAWRDHALVATFETIEFITLHHQ